MNETERDRILLMVSEGTLRPNEAAQLLAVLAEEPTSGPAEKTPEIKEMEKPKQIEVQMQRADGTYYSVQVPPNLIPMFWQLAKVAIKESARTAAQETWDGFKNIVKNKTEEVKTNVRQRIVGGKPEEGAAVAQEAESQVESRRRIIQMVQNGRITATDAARLIEQLDALEEYQKANPPAPAN